MNQIAKGDDTARLRSQLTAMGSEIKNALPSHIKPEKFQRVVMTVVQTSPDLLVADRRSLLGACLKCAADGLIPDGREAALVIFNTKSKDGGWEKRVQYMPMMAGILKKIRNAGQIASVQAHVIYEHDHFVIRRGLNDTLEHEPKFPGERGNPIGAYAVAKFKDGSEPQFEVMDLDQINKVRSVSRAKDSGPWSSWWDEMARKTVFRRLSKWLPMDAEVEDLMRRDDEPPEGAGSSPLIDGEADDAKPSKLDALESAATSGTIEGDAEAPKHSESLTQLLTEIRTLTAPQLMEWQQNAAVRSRIGKLSTDERAVLDAAIAGGE